MPRPDVGRGILLLLGFWNGALARWRHGTFLKIRVCEIHPQVRAALIECLGCDHSATRFA
jgi:hypothetical protein